MQTQSLSRYREMPQWFVKRTTAQGGFFKFTPLRQPLWSRAADPHMEAFLSLCHRDSSLCRGSLTPHQSPSKRRWHTANAFLLKASLCVKGGGARKLHSLKSLPCVKGGGARKLHSLKSLPCAKGGGSCKLHSLKSLPCAKGGVTALL